MDMECLCGSLGYVYIPLRSEVNILLNSLYIYTHGHQTTIALLNY